MKRTICLLMTVAMLSGTAFAEGAEIVSESVTIVEPVAKTEEKPVEASQEENRENAEQPVKEEKAQASEEQTVSKESAETDSKEAESANEAEKPSESETVGNATEEPNPLPENTEGQVPEVPEEVPAVAEDEPSETSEEEEVSESVREEASEKRLKIKKLELIPSEKHPAIGETVTLTVLLTVANRDGAAIDDFILEIGYDGAASGDAYRKVVSGAVASDGVLMLGQEPLTVSVDFVPFGGQGEKVTATVRLKDADDNKEKIASAKMVFDNTETGAETNEVVEESFTETEKEASEAFGENDAVAVENGTDPEQESAEKFPTEKNDEENSGEEVSPENEENDPAEDSDNGGTEEPSDGSGDADPDNGTEAVAGDVVQEEGNVAETQDELPQIRVALETNADPATLAAGETLSMHAVIEGIPEEYYVVRWQCNEGDGEWKTIEGETGDRFSVVVGDAVRGWSWRFIVEPVESTEAE